MTLQKLWQTHRVFLGLRTRLLFRRLISGRAILDHCLQQLVKLLMFLLNHLDHLALLCCDSVIQNLDFLQQKGLNI